MSTLHAFARDIWIVDGPPVSAFGPVTLPTRMIVVKLGDGSIWINSPVEPSLQLIDEVRAIGPVRFLVAPTPLHTWRLESWHTLFPDAQLWVPPMLTDLAPAQWAEDIEQLVFQGNVFLDEVEFFHKSSRTVMITDFIQNYPAVNGDTWGNLVKAIAGVLNGGVPRDIRWSFTKRIKGRDSRAKLLAWDFDKVIVAHGASVERGGKPFVEAAFRWLL